MLRVSGAVVLVLVVAAGLPAQERPQGPPPRIMTTTVDKDGRAVLTVTITTFREEIRLQKTVVNDKEVIQKVIVCVPVTSQFRVALDGPDAEVYGIDGKRIDLKNVKMRAGMPVLVSADGRPVDPFYLQLAREGTLVVVVRVLVMPKDGPVPLPIVLPKKDEELKLPAPK